MTRDARWAAPLLHPLPLAATALLALNDQLLKPAFALTPPLLGKLSDLCGLFVFPLLLSAVAQLLCGRRRRGVDLAALGLTAAGFVAANLSASFNALLGALWIDKLMDPSDLWALAALAPSAWWLRRCRCARALAVAPLARWLALAAVLLACAATQPPRHPRAYAVWQLPEKHSASIGDATVQAWVSKSGKSGCGVTLRVRGRGPIALLEAELRVAGGASVRAVTQRRQIVAAGGQGGAHYVYLPFAFDNQAAWNAGSRRGELRLVFEVAGQRHELRVEARHVRPATHRTVSRQRSAAPGIQRRHPNQPQQRAPDGQRAPAAPRTNGTPRGAQ